MYESYRSMLSSFRSQPVKFFQPWLLAFIALATPNCALAQPPVPANAAFDAYISRVESELAEQHKSPGGLLLVIPPEQTARLRQGELVIQDANHAGRSPDGAMFHHWRGTAFAPGAKASDFLRVMKDFDRYPQRYAPQVAQAKILKQDGDRYQVTMRVKQKHVITVVMDTDYDVTFRQQDLRRGYTLSRSTRIAEIGAPWTSHERVLPPGEEHGFMWRLNTYWSYEERDGGLYMQIESISLSRSIPTGLAWAIGPFVASVPRESLEFTLRSTCSALRR